MTKKILKKKAKKKTSGKRAGPIRAPGSAGTSEVWKGNPKLESWLVPIDDVKTNPNNTRRHSEKDVAATAVSLEEHGQQWPVLVQPEDMVLLAGEGRWLAAKKLGWTHISALASDISGEGERTLFSIRDNRTAELSNWDVSELSQQLQELQAKFDLPATGLWEDYELEPLLGADWSPPDAGDMPGLPGGEGDGGPSMGEPLRLTSEQREVVDRAVVSVREHEGYKDITEGRCVELICGDFLAGPQP